MLAISVIWIKVMIFLVSGHISWLLLFYISAVPKGEERTLRCLTKAWFPGLARTFCVNFGMLLCCLSFCFIFSSLKWHFLLYRVSAFIGASWVLQIWYKGKGSDSCPVVFDTVQASMRLCPCLAGLADECGGNPLKMCEKRERCHSFVPREVKLS